MEFHPKSVIASSWLAFYLLIIIMQIRIGGKLRRVNLLGHTNTFEYAITRKPQLQ